MFTKNKVFAYENSDGDKGIIIARSIDEAEKIFHKKYPERKIVDNYYDYFDILPRINPWDSLDYNNITSPIGVDIV